MSPAPPALPDHPEPTDEALRVVIADDEPAALRRLARLLREMPDVAVVGECGSGREALEAARTLAPDVLFLDIEMPGLDGLAVARQLAVEDGPLVVFVTAYDEHAIAAFRVHAADYVVKPLDRARLRDAVEHARRTAHARRAPSAATLPRLAVRDGYRTHFVPLSELLWVESFGNYVRVHTPRVRHLHRATMAQVARQLAPLGFTRIHRHAIVNAARIVHLGPGRDGHYEVCLDSGLRLRVGRTYRAPVAAMLASRTAPPPPAP